MHTDDPMHRTTLEAVFKDLIETLEDGRKGFEDGATKLEESGRPDMAIVFRKYAEQRGRFSAELRNIAASHHLSIDESGSLAGALHRGWMALKDALSADDPDGVLDAAEQGEDHAVGEYDKALARYGEVVDGAIRDVIVRQWEAVKAAHDDVKAMRDRVS